MHVNSPRITKSLGACSPRETPMKEPTSAHELSSYVLLVGMPICPNAGKQVQTSLRQPREENASSGNQHPLQGKSASPGNQHPLQGRKCLAKLSPNTWLNSPFAGFCPSNLFSLSYASWAACALKGSPRHRASRDLTSRGLMHPPALWSPDSHIPKRRWCSAKRGS